MIARTAAFDQAIVAGANAVVAVEVVRNGVTVLSLNPQPGTAVVTLDETQPARRTVTMQIANNGTLAPHTTHDPLAPYGDELVVRSGVRYADGTTELLPAGVFRFNVTAGTSLGQLTVSGPDRSAVIAAALNETPYVIAAATALDDAIGGYLAAKYPAVQFSADDAAHSIALPATPTVYLEGTQSGDPWTNMRNLAGTFGRELYFDASGRAVLRLIPDPSTTAPVWSYAPGTSNLAIPAATRTMDTTGVANVVVVAGQGTGVATPVSGKAEITDPTSPVFPDPSGFGRRVQYVSSPQLTTGDQCTAAAQSLLLRAAVGADNIGFPAVPHPAHEPGDVVRYASTLLGIDTNLVLSSWQLSVDLMAQASYKTRRTT